MTFLVTGAAGFIGSHSVDLLVEKGFSVVGIDTLRSGDVSNLKSAASSRCFAFHPIDVTDESKLRALFKRYRFDGVLHLAALVSVAESFTEAGLNAQINLYGTDLLARLCKEYGCQRFVFASSAAVYGNSDLLPNRESHQPNPRSPYAGAKLASEMMLLAYGASFGLEAVCFRYFNVYGPRQNPHSPYSGVLSIFLERFRTHQPVTVYGDGEQTRDFIAVQDVAAANVHALTVNSIVSGQYNICTGRATALNRILDILCQAYPNPPPIQYADPRIGDIRHSLGDPTFTQQKLGITATVSLEDGLQKIFAVAPR